MRRRALTAVIVLGLTACGSSTARPGTTATRGSHDVARRVPCGPVSASTIAADREARIYRVGKTVYGCATRTRQRTRLGQTRISTPGQPRLELVRLAGSDAAFALSSSGVDTGSADVEVIRLSDGRRMHRAPAVDQGLVEAYQSVPSLVLRDDGAVAWIGEVASIVRHQRLLEVHRIDGGGAALLDRGGSIAADSLALRGTRLSWRDGRRQRTATLR